MKMHRGCCNQQPKRPRVDPELMIGLGGHPCGYGFAGLQNGGMDQVSRKPLMSGNVRQGRMGFPTERP